jgi:hypothetical protein
LDEVTFVKVSLG